MMNFIVPLLFLTVLFPSTTPTPMLAIVVRSNADIIPARVLLHSYSLHADLPHKPHIFALSPVSTSSLHSVFPPLSIPFTNLPKSTFPLLHLFNLTAQSHIIVLHPHLLVVDSLKLLQHCKPFCASFHTPCSFDTKLMALVPNQTTHAFLQERIEALQMLETTTCSLENTPDWLDEESCILNAHFGKALLNSPLFNVQVKTKDSLEVGTRLPPAVKLMHHLYYPRMRWENPAGECGSRSVLDFSTPRVLQPWHWWTYALLELSWEWRKYRLGSEVWEGGFEFFIGVMMIGLGFLGIWTVVVRKRELGRRFWGRVENRVKWLRVIGMGCIGGALSWVLGVLCVPEGIGPLYGWGLMLGWRIFWFVGIWVWIGGGGNGRKAWTSVLWGMFESLLVLAGGGLGNLWKAETGLTRFVLVLGIGGGVGVIVGAVGVVKMGKLWIGDEGEKGKKGGGNKFPS